MKYDTEGYGRPKSPPPQKCTMTPIGLKIVTINKGQVTLDSQSALSIKSKDPDASSDTRVSQIMERRKVFNHLGLTFEQRKEMVMS